MPRRVPREESSVTNIWLLAVTAVVSTTRVEPPVAIATLPEGAEPQTAGEVEELQLLLVATESVELESVSPLPMVSDCRGIVPLPNRMPCKVLTPVPPLATATVPVTFAAVPPILSEEVATVSVDVPLKAKPAPRSSDLIKPKPFPTRIPPSAVVLPVPPPSTPRLPESVGLKVKVPPLLLIFWLTVRPLKVAEEVAKIIGPVCGVPNVWAIELTPLPLLLALPLIQTPFTAKHPLERLIPLP